MSHLHFHESMPPAPAGYAKRLVEMILKEKPELRGQALINEVNARKHYEVNAESVARYARDYEKPASQQSLL